MRTKTLVCAAILAAGIATTMAQSNVYSLNVVGYYNITVASGPSGKIMIANQLNTTNNTIGALLAPPMVGNNDALFFYAGGFTAYTYSTDDGQWDGGDGNADALLNPGVAAFYQNASGSTETLTFVGTVLQGSLTNTLPLGVKVMRASMVPQQGLVSTDLGVPYDNNDALFTFAGGYTAFTYSTDDGQWDNYEPTINVGQGFFYVKAPTANPANALWIRNFTVQ